MLGIEYLKAEPTTYVLHYRQGRVMKEGAGLSFFYLAPASSIVEIPLASRDAPFVFNEVTADFQAVTAQGRLSYRDSDPGRLAGLLDFSVDANGRYHSEDPQKLEQRLVHEAQVLARSVTQRFPLRELLVHGEELGSEVLAGLRRDPAVAALGGEILGLAFLSLKPSPEMSKALEADTREALQRRADEAIYARRNAAVEQERLIKESELSTEIAVEEKKREIREAQMAAEIAVEEKKRIVRETQMAAEIAVEEQRTRLVDRRVENERKDADSRAYAMRVTLDPIRDIDWRTLMMLAASRGADPRTLIALAFQEMAQNAQKIGELNISPDLLRTLIGAPGAK